MAVDPDSLPLRDRIREAEKLTRDLTDHVQNTYLSRVRELEQMTTQEAPPVGDMTVRMGVARTLQAHDNMEQMWEQAQRYLASIREDIERIMEEA